MKTLHLINCWHRQSGGIATFYRAMMRAAEAQGRPIRLVVPGETDAVADEGRWGRIYYVRGRPAPFNREYRLVMPQSYLLPNGPVRRILAAERPDLVECCDKYTLNYLAGLLRVGWLGFGGHRPTVVGISCERMDDNMARYLSPGTLGRRFCRLYMQWLYFPLCDHHIAVSPYTATELHEASFGHRCRRGVWVRPMGVDCSLFTPDRRREEACRRLRALTGASEEATLLLYVGRLAPEKNPGLLLDTLRILESQAPGQFHLVLAGDGPMRRELESGCRRDLPGAVCFLGHIGDREALAGLYANCDLLLHPNSSEPFGIAPLEAMASGLPVIGPDSGGITSYAGDGNAVLVPAEPAAFARACRELQNDSERIRRLREAGRQTSRRYDWPTVAAGFFELYEELHALTQGTLDNARLQPAFYSTTRRRFGWES